MGTIAYRIVQDRYFDIELLEKAGIRDFRIPASDDKAYVTKRSKTQRVLKRVKPQSALGAQNAAGA